MSKEELFLVCWLISGFIGCLLGSTRDRKGLGLVLGLLLGPIGWTTVLFMPHPREGSGAPVLLAAAFLTLVFAGALTLRLTRPEIGRSLLALFSGKPPAETVKTDYLADEGPVVPASPAAPIRIKCQHRQLVIVRGIVVKATEEGVAVEIMPPSRLLEHRQGESRSRSGQATSVNAAQLAELAFQGAQERLGQLVTLETGVLGPPLYIPQDVVEGEAWLIGHPRQRFLSKGMGLNVVALPLQDGVYTMNFEISEPANSWMFLKKAESNPLDRPSYKLK